MLTGKWLATKGFPSSPSPNSEDAGLEEDKAVRFIHPGGPVVINRKVHHQGARHAQRIILEGGVLFS